jgi:hypothetical protein
MRSLLAVLCLLFVTPAFAAPPCFTHEMQLDGLNETKPTHGEWLNKKIIKKGDTNTFLSVTVRATNPEVAYIATFEGGCYAGRFITVQSHEVKELFTPIEWGSLAARGI